MHNVLMSAINIRVRRCGEKSNLAILIVAQSDGEKSVGRMLEWCASASVRAHIK